MDYVPQYKRRDCLDGKRYSRQVEARGKRWLLYLLQTKQTNAKAITKDQEIDNSTVIVETSIPTFNNG